MGPLLRVTPDCSQSAAQDWAPIGGSAVEGSTSEVTQVLGRIHFLLAVGLVAAHFVRDGNVETLARLAAHSCVIAYNPSFLSPSIG